MGEIIISIILLLVAFSSGTLIEKRHYKSIRQREKAYLTIPILTTKELPVESDKIESVQLVGDGVVIAGDHFKMFLAGLINLVGGRITTYESLIDRARREATLRMMKKARLVNADMIINFRIETSNINSIQDNSEKHKNAAIEAFAYGTAIRVKK